MDDDCDNNLVLKPNIAMLRYAKFYTFYDGKIIKILLDITFIILLGKS